MNKMLKKNISALLAFIMALTCLTGFTLVNAQDGVEINAANFPDEAFRSYVLSMYDTEETSPGVLTPEEISPVKTMFLTGMSDIADLKGIEYFTSLESLYAQFLAIEQADFSALSNLKRLIINGNELLRTLDVSANQNLETLICWGCISLEDLAVPASLTELQCQLCALSRLDVSQCAQLKTLRCYDNQISYLDLSNNTLLETLMCNNNRLSSLDLSANTLLTDLTDQDVGAQTVSVAAAASGKTISVPVSGLDAQRVVVSDLLTYNSASGAFESSDYSVAQNGFDYAYGVNFVGNPVNMSVHVNVSKDFYKVSYYESQGGNLIDYSFVASGGSIQAPAFPQAPEGYVCPSWSGVAQNVVQDTDIYAVWNENHTYSVVDYKEMTATIRCSVCSDEYQKSFADCYNSKKGDPDYDPLLDYNRDGYINSRDHAMMRIAFNG